MLTWIFGNGAGGGAGAHGLRVNHAGSSRPARIQRLRRGRRRFPEGYAGSSRPAPLPRLRGGRRRVPEGGVRTVGLRGGGCFPGAKYHGPFGGMVLNFAVLGVQDGIGGADEGPVVG